MIDYFPHLQLFLFDRTMIDVLPGLLEVPAESKCGGILLKYQNYLFCFFLAETRFLHAVFDNYPLNNIQFRLSPVYTLYMALRHRLSPYGKPNIPLAQKQESIISLLYRIEDMISKKIEVRSLRNFCPFAFLSLYRRNAVNMAVFWPIGLRTHRRC
jgi:hypothetical protein